MSLTPEQVAATFDAWSSGHPEGAAPTRVKAPIQIIISDSDPVVSGPLVHDLILPRFPGAPVVTITSSGHWPHAEQPSQVVEAISRFVTATHALNPRRPRKHHDPKGTPDQFSCEVKDTGGCRCMGLAARR